MEKLEEEMAKAAGQIVVDTAKDSRKAIAVLFGDTVREFGLTLGDQARYLRFKSLTGIMDKVERIRRERGYTAEQMKVLPFGDSIRVLEAASLEEEEDVQELWARLIANASAPEGTVSIKKLYIDLLKSLSPIEATFLDLLWGCRSPAFRTLQEVKAYNAAMNANFDKRWRSYPESERHGAIQNLLRLRCISVRLEPIQVHNLLGRAPRELVDGGALNSWSFIDERKFRTLLDKIVEQIAIAGGSKEFIPKSGRIANYTWGAHLDVPELNYLFTSLGLDLMAACSIDGQATEIIPDEEGEF